MINNPEAEQLFYAGNRQMQAKDFSSAKNSFKQAIEIQPDFGEAWANLGHLHANAGEVELAERCFRQAINTRPNVEEAHLMFGVLLMNQKRFAESEQTYRNYLDKNAHSAAAWSNLGVLLACLKRESEAEECYHTALQCDPTYTKASFNLSYILLRQQRWEEGWRCLEDRWEYPLLATHFTCPRWQGESLQGKSIIIGFEAGHGDMIFYCRYIAELKSRGARHIALICHPNLKQLFNTLSGVDELFSFNEEVPKAAWDYWAPPISLPYYFQTTRETIPAAIPYLYAEPSKIKKWKSLLVAEGEGKRIGLVWRGNISFENDADRSIQSLSLLKSFGDVAGVHWISLQKGCGEEEAKHPPAGLKLLALGDQLQDFSDTAAVIQSLDLVISVDTAVAHLAGAMGVPCWVLLPDYRSDWRWHLDQHVTPWYPHHMRLFRQPAGGGWSPVIDNVINALNTKG